MVLITKVTQNAASKNNGTYLISMNMVLTDDAVEVIDQNYSQNHNPANNISVARDEIMKRMQKDIDNYKATQVVSDSVAFKDIATYINSKLVV